jgi:hypothetical protein
MKLGAERLPMESTRFVDRRRSLRVHEAISIGIAIAPENYRVEHEAFTMNQSLQGVRIRTAIPLLPEEMVVAFPRGDSRHATPARVVWVRRPISSAGYIAGLEFLSLSAA